MAGPGTGKTRTLTHRIARRVLSGDVPPGEVLAVTFTNRAAAEMRERLRRLLGPAPCERITIGTFHALGLAILRAETGAAGLAPGFRVIDEEERAGLVALALAPEGEEEGEASHARAAAARRDLDTGGCLPPAPAGETSPLRARYDEIKASRNVVDFDDLVRLPLALFARRPDVAARWARRYRFVCVDEYQDLNPAQYALVRALLPPGGGDLTAIGDPHQAIYAFRGADARFFQRFEHDFPRARVLRLERSYRSTECIVAGATQVLAASQGGGGGGDEILWSGIRGPEWIEIRPAPTARAEAETVVAEIERLVGGVREFSIDSGRVDSAAAGRGFSFSDIAVLYRLRALRAPLVEALERAGLPYQTADHHAALGEPGVREIEGRLRGMRGDPGLPVAERVAAAAGEGPWRDPLVELARGFGTDLEAFLDHLALGRGVDLLAPRGERIRLLTLHASKGLEFPVVFLVGCEEGVLPWTGPPGETDPADPEEERRLLYVGMTRARTLLIVTHARKRVLFGRRTPGRPSPFLKDIEQALRATRDPAAGGRRSPPPADRQPTLF